MLQIIYASAAKVSFSHKNLVGLLRIARERNTAAEISGMLLYHSGSFLQVLEGPEKQVDALYAKVQKDPRHNKCLLILRRTIQEKEFENWSMGFVDMAQVAARFEGFIDYADQLKDMTLDETGARNFLKKFQEGAWRRSESGACF